MTSFAQKQLEKYGWKKGQGLGAQGDGIVKPITLGLKSNRDGIGHNANEWNSNWWDSIYNKTSSSIQIQQDETNGIQVCKSMTVQEKKDYSISISDKELFKACGKRSARKGARVDQDGKVKRVKESSKVSKKEKKRKKSKKIDV